MKTALVAFVALAGSLALLNLVSDHHDQHPKMTSLCHDRNCWLQKPTRGLEVSPQFNHALDKQIASINAQLPIETDQRK